MSSSSTTTKDPESQAMPPSTPVSSSPTSGNNGGGGLELSSKASSDTAATESNNKGKEGGAMMTTMGSFKLLLLVMMVLQNSSTVLVGRYTRASVPKDELYEVNHLILITELGKFFLSCCLEFYTSKGKLYESMQLHIFQRPMDAMKISVPALLYLVQNTLLYVALSNLTAPIFQVTYQGKLVTTALVSVVMLQRSYSAQQWICLVGLSVGVAIVVLGEGGGNKSQEEDEAKAADEAAKHQNLFVGLTAVTIACMSSALAGVYFEKVLKRPSQDISVPASLWMRNMQLAFFSVLIALGQGGYQSMKHPQEDQPKSFFHGFGFWVWILVGLQAGGGLLVAAVIKYADNVLKGLATGVSVVLSSSLSVVLFGTALSSQFGVGAVLILTSVYLFSNPMPVAMATAIANVTAGKAASPAAKTEAKSLLPK